jgi:hypothetical protein
MQKTVAQLEVNVEEAVVGGQQDDEQQRLKRQRTRSVAIALGLGFLVLLFYAATIVRMGGHH